MQKRSRKLRHLQQNAFSHDIQVNEHQNDLFSKIFNSSRQKLLILYIIDLWFVQHRTNAFEPNHTSEFYEFVSSSSQIQQTVNCHMDSIVFSCFARFLRSIFSFSRNYTNISCSTNNFTSAIGIFLLAVKKSAVLVLRLQIYLF